jgi:cytoskeletal protein RodZ
MPDIGASLREQRMRSRIDITEIEAQTKIRAKYLRALENEEWDLLPGPTYVKTFLRTYADALGLDGRMLVEEYKLRHERLSDVDLQPISPRSARDRGRERPKRSRFPRFGLVALVVVGLVVALYALGRGADDSNSPSGSGSPVGTSTSTTPTRTGTTTTARSTPPKPATLRITATGAVVACVQAADGRKLVNGRTLQAGQSTSTLRSGRFRLVLSNGQARLRVNGRTRALPPSDRPVGYAISRSGKITGLGPSQRPVCTT